MKYQIVPLSDDDTNRERLRKLIDKLSTEAPKASLLILDLTRVKMINSGVLCEIMRLHKDFRAMAGDVFIAGPSHDVNLLLDNSRLNKIIRVYNTLAAAVRAIENPEPGMV